MPVHWKLQEDEFAFIVEDADAELLFVSPGMEDAARRLTQRCRRLRRAVLLEGRAEGLASWAGVRVRIVDDQGRVHITDRIKDLIISAGENLYPAELEQALLTHPGVADVAVVSIPDKRWGEVPLAYVVAKPESGLTKAALMAHATARLPAFKVPHDAVFIERLPRNPTGKVLKRVLRDSHWEGRTRRVN